MSIALHMHRQKRFAVAVQCLRHPLAPAPAQTLVAPDKAHRLSRTVFRLSLFGAGWSRASGSVLTTVVPLASVTLTSTTVGE